MSLLLILVILLVLLGGGGFYAGGPRVGGSLAGLILLILIILALTGRLLGSLMQSWQLLQGPRPHGFGFADGEQRDFYQCQLTVAFGLREGQPSS